MVPGPFLPLRKIPDINEGLESSLDTATRLGDAALVLMEPG
jgi:hypothetical protein